MGRMRLRDEQGMVLPIALGILAVLTISAMVVIDSSSSNARSAVRSKGDKVAFALAEAGINNAIAVLMKPGTNALNKYDYCPASDTAPALPCWNTNAYEGGTVQWTGQLTVQSASAYWTLTSTSTVRNPDGSRPLHRTLTARAPVYPAPSQPLNSPSWNYIYSRALGTGVSVQRLRHDADEPGRGDLAALRERESLPREQGADRGRRPVRARLADAELDPELRRHLGGEAERRSHRERLQVRRPERSHAVHRRRPVGRGQSVGAHARHERRRGPAAERALERVVPERKSRAVLPLQPRRSRARRRTPPGPGTRRSPPEARATATKLTYKNNNAGLVNLTPPTSYSCKTWAGELSWNATTRVLTINGDDVPRREREDRQRPDELVRRRGRHLHVRHVAGQELETLRKARLPRTRATARRPAGTRTRT